MVNDVAIITARRALSNKAIAERDLDGIVAVMTPDAVVSVAGGPRLSGREESKAAFADQFADRSFVGYTREVDRIVVSENSKQATEQGRWAGRWRLNPGDHIMRGTYTAEWRRIDGEWMIQSEIFVERPR